LSGKGRVCPFASTASNDVKSFTLYKAGAISISRTGSERLSMNGWTVGLIGEKDGDEYKEYYYDGGGE
jgi:hypothetical protein